MINRLISLSLLINCILTVQCIVNVTPVYPGGDVQVVVLHLELSMETDDVGTPVKS